MVEFKEAITWHSMLESFTLTMNIRVLTNHLSPKINQRRLLILFLSYLSKIIPLTWFIYISQFWCAFCFPIALRYKQRVFTSTMSDYQLVRKTKENILLEV
jgi:hypothetical protein